MNKAELVAAAAVAAEVSKKDAEAVVDAVLHEIEEKLIHGEEVKISGFGIFAKKERAERTGSNPSTHEKITIAASKTVTFKPAKGLKAKL